MAAKTKKAEGKKGESGLEETGYVKILWNGLSNGGGIVYNKKMDNGL